jgi:predicted amidohydrolase YtcJ
MTSARRHRLPALVLSATLLIASAAVPLGAAPPHPEGPAVERVYLNATIFTAVPERPYAEALSIRGDRIVAVGSRDEVLRSVGPTAERIDLEGRTLLPGLVDSHTHPVDGGLALTSADVGESIDSVEALTTFAADARASGRGMRGDIVYISGIPLRFWSRIAALNATFNSGAYATVPVFLDGMDGHTGWANQVLLARAGVTRDFIAGLPEAERKYHGSGPDSEPNGFAVDAGLGKVRRIIPGPTREQLLAAGRAAVEYNHSLGITAWLDASADESTLATYKALADAGGLTAHVSALPRVEPRNDPDQELVRVQRLRREYAGIRNLSLPGLKVFADGVVETPSQSAALLTPYRNTGKNGDLLFDPARFAALCTAADKLGLIVHVHAIGDLAVREALNGIEAARHANGNSRLPHTITHLQFVDPADIPRFGALGVIASFQLYWASANVDAIDLVQPYVDPAIFPWQYPARSVLESGGTLAGASDWPVSTANVFAAMYQAETRDGPLGTLNARQRVPRMAMLYAYTRDAARALGLDETIGSLAPGRLADLVLVDRDVLTVSAEALKDTTVLWTMFEGRVVYRAKP